MSIPDHPGVELLALGRAGFGFRHDGWAVPCVNWTMGGGCRAAGWRCALESGRAPPVGSGSLMVCGSKLVMAL